GQAWNDRENLAFEDAKSFSDLKKPFAVLYFAFMGGTLTSQHRDEVRGRAGDIRSCISINQTRAPGANRRE
ncbi:MAG: hypothetical protein WB573_17395, partial [Terracidiphilus sp.]